MHCFRPRLRTPQAPENFPSPNRETPTKLLQILYQFTIPIFLLFAPHALITTPKLCSSVLRTTTKQNFLKNTVELLVPLRPQNSCSWKSRPSMQMGSSLLSHFLLHKTYVVANHPSFVHERVRPPRQKNKRKKNTVWMELFFGLPPAPPPASSPAEYTKNRSNAQQFIYRERDKNKQSKCVGGRNRRLIS
jgi:hypothetical protein